MADGFMFKDEKEFASLKAGVLGYLQRDIDKLLDTKALDAEFVNIASSNKPYGLTWLLFRVYYSFESLNHTESVLFVYPIQQNLFTRDPNNMRIVDQAAKIMGKQNRLSDIDLVKVRILYHIYQIIKDIQNDDFPANITLPTTKYIVINYADAGNLNWGLFDTLPGGFN